MIINLIIADEVLHRKIKSVPMLCEICRNQRQTIELSLVLTVYIKIIAETDQHDPGGSSRPASMWSMSRSGAAGRDINFFL